MSTLPAGAIVCYTKCWPCQFGEHQKGQHPWADAEDVLHAFVTRHVDIRKSVCGCWCVQENPEAISDDIPPVDVVQIGEPCLVCGEPNACAYDVEGRALIHAVAIEDES